VKSFIFVIRWFFHAEIVFFEESVLWNTLLSVNVDQCHDVNVFLELVGLVTLTDRVWCRVGNLAVSRVISAFSRRYWLNGTLSQVLWVYVRSDVISNHGIFSHHSDTQVLWVFVCSDVINNH
jgi:hypothetical protein